MALQLDSHPNGEDCSAYGCEMTFTEEFTLNKTYYVYILTNWNDKVMYVGVTNDLERRLYEHKNKLMKGFTAKYNLDKLVYYEVTNDVNTAIQREKEIKNWRRERKNTLVNEVNPTWQDLSDGWR